MAEPEPIDPTPESTHEPRPDWLVGAEEGAQSEYVRPPLPAPPVDLHRPVAPEEPGRVGLPLPSAPAPKPEPAAPEKPTPWRAAASSVPQLRLVAPTAKPSSAPELSRRFVDEEEPSTPDPAPLPDDEHSLGEEQDPKAESSPRMPDLARKGVGLDEPWWLIATERLATDRKLQMMIGGALALVIAIAILWPRGSASVGLGNLRHHPERFQGQTVQVEGRVGDVFSVGGAYAFNLHQGRDTLVIYTRTRTPVSRQKVKVIGSLSMGYLDGVPRLALFETGP
jgi:hypothetical protein